jgi:hypothetical protein
MVAVKGVIIEDENNVAPLVIKKALAMIRNLHEKFGYVDSKIYLLFDNPESVISIRKVVDSEYKSCRLKKSVPKGIYETLGIFIEILKSYSDQYYICRVPSLEADDLPPAIIKTLKIDNNNKALIISNDLDWSRNITDNISWYNYNDLYSVSKFQKEFKFSPRGKAVQMYKAIHGDRSDNIENAVPRLPKEILLDIVNRFDSIDDLFKNLWKKETEYPHDWKMRLKEAENNIRKNFTLVDFMPLEIKTEDFIIECKRRPKLLRIFFKSFNLSLEKDMHSKEDAKQPFFVPKKTRKFI